MEEFGGWPYDEKSKLIEIVSVDPPSFDDDLVHNMDDEAFVSPSRVREVVREINEEWQKWEEENSKKVDLDRNSNHLQEECGVYTKNINSSNHTILEFSGGQQGNNVPLLSNKGEQSLSNNSVVGVEGCVYSNRG
ncbi:hypothetical protein A2U01_0029639 [Trifolium medium]|uniref:Uncharacterized protein n=1 Tax=Trifolium medium TaxID=97028 RepID=A0A392P9Z8_9FABA|nr:hypothetical protein [Trifolium medium]